MKSIPLADASRLRRAAGRTDVVRIALAVILLALVGTIAAVVGHARVRTLHLLPPGSTAIVVLDLSASVSQDTYARIGATLSDLVASKGRYGVVVFSGSAYEALPPNTPAEELRPLIRYFTLPAQQTPGYLPSFPPSPWAGTFSAGTRISSGLDLARRLALNSGLSHPGVILISDLSDDPSDLRRTALTILAYRRDRLPLRVVGLNAAPADAAFFRKLIGGDDTITDARLPEEASPVSGGRGFPWALAALAVLAALALAANDMSLARVTWKEQP